MNKFEKVEDMHIIGLRDVKIDYVDIFLKKIKIAIYPVRVQVVDAKRVAGVKHLIFAFINAKKSIEKSYPISENLEMETLLYASGQRQISKAIEMLGIKPDTSKIALLLFLSDKNVAKEVERKLRTLKIGIFDDKVLEVKEKGKIEDLITTFKVTELELKAMSANHINKAEILSWLIVERVALLSTEH